MNARDDRDAMNARDDRDAMNARGDRDAMNARGDRDTMIAGRPVPAYPPSEKAACALNGKGISRP